MTLGTTLQIAVSGLRTAQRALQVTANNVANVSTPGYARKLHAQEPLVLAGEGRGARALVERRVVDEFLATELRMREGRLGRSAVIEEFADRAQSLVFGTPGDTSSGIAGRLHELARALQALANDPDEPALRAAVVGAAESFARTVARSAEAIQALRRDADRRIDALVDAINEDLRALHELERETLRGGETPELADRRDRILRELNRKIDISTYRLDEGRLGILAGGGRPLLEAGPRVLVYEPPPVVEAGTIFGPIEIYAARDIDPATGEPSPGAKGAVLVTGGLRAELPPELATGTPADVALIIRSPLRSGELQGLLEVRDRLLPELADRLDELARIAAFALNAAHNAATAWPPPQSLVGTRREDGTFDAATRSGTAWLAVVDRASGAVLHTIAVDVAADFATLVSDLDTALAGYGDAAVDAQGRLRIALSAGYGIALSEGDSAISFTDAPGHDWTYGFAHYFGLNDLLVSEPGRPSRMGVHETLRADPGRLATARLAVDPGPPPSAALGGPGDPRGVQGLVAAFQREIETVARGRLSAVRTTVGGYAADLVAAHAAATREAEAEAGADRALVTELETRWSAVSGVNLDEELSRLVLYQQAYTVSARIVEITDRLFDELLAIAR
ncbi:MAG: flagellar basal body protein [Geminicoccaceae bacterium]|nr:flagellar basal body protein [Geminicoccaceae bacterium]